MTAPLLLIMAALQGGGGPAPVVLDDFERVAAWSAHPAQGVDMSLHRDSAGYSGAALRLDFAFTHGGGYAVAHRALALDLPANYKFTFWIRGRSAPNTLEFKLIDSTGDNVWWYRQQDRRFDGAWHEITVRRRQIAFAWGPRGGGVLRHVAALEIVITAGTGGGSGSVWLDDLEFTPLPNLGPYHGHPVATASAALPRHAARLALDGDSATAWRTPAVPGGAATLTVDFGRSREFGGVSLQWEPGRGARDYDLLFSDDGRNWRTVRRIRGGHGGWDHLDLPDSDARYLRLRLRAATGSAGYGLRDLVVQPLEVGASRNAYFAAVARTAPTGSYPPYFLGRRPFWTVVAGDGSRAKGLIDEDGAVDAGPGAFSVEPFLSDSTFLTWHDVEHHVRLLDGDLPMPVVAWDAGELHLTIAATSIGPPERPSLLVRYRVWNTGTATRRPTLYLVIRPFQVDPPWQFLGTPGGVARIDSLRWTGTELHVNGDRVVRPLTAPARVATATTDAAGGGVVAQLRSGVVPGSATAHDSSGAASAALVYPLTLAPGDSARVALEIPLTPNGPARLPTGEPGAVRRAYTDAADRWRTTLGGPVIQMPDSGRDLAGAIRASIGWILANRDGSAIQPGARSYARSWIRDGALMSAALLRFGHAAVVRDYIDWYAPHVYPDGKVPCCVDARGADPVSEFDSNGEFIYLVMDYWRHTRDRALLERMWPTVTRAVAFLDSLRRSDRTAAYEAGDARVFYGLLPPSISHEGYSAKPMHSYWDDLWALRGFTDAAAMARALGHDADAARIAGIRDQFRTDLLASLQLAMRRHGIDYLPGAADLGDFDPTSTTIVFDPVEVADRLPAEAVRSTFQRYWNRLAPRREPGGDWDAYAGYEVRAVGAMLRLGWKARALTLLHLFLADREPPAWDQWPEVIYHDPHAPKFVGDEPHTWVSADFLRSAADLFAYPRAADSALVIGAGLESTWLGGRGVRVNGLDTRWGPVAYTARWEGVTARVHLQASVRIPPGGLVVCAPLPRAAREIRLDGTPVAPDSTGAVVVRRLPADVEFSY